MLRRLGVRGKILATLAMPILVLALAAGWVSWDSLRTARTADQTAELVASLAAQDSAGSAFAAERSLNIAAALGIPGAQESLASAFEQTDKALATRDDALAAVDTDALDVRVRRAISATRADRQQIRRLQEQILDGTIPESEATKQYNEYIENALTVARELGGTTQDSTLSLHLDAYVAMDETMLDVVYERPIVGAVLAGAMTGQVDQSSVLRTVTTIDATNRQFEATKAQLDRLPGGHRLPPLDGDLATVRTALGQMDVAALDPAAAGQWNQATQDWVAASQPIRDGVRDETASYAQWLADEARTSAIVTAGAAFGVLALSILIALSVARRIVRPLRRLTAATGEIRDRLPQMVEQMAVPGHAPTIDLFEIPVESQDEIGRLAQSFNDVNATTVAVAQEQAALRGSIAEMFVNVARRDQVLLNRQLAFLDELERTEEDPSALASLFRLDHLATRMRRNAESLLVLAGIDAGRKGRAPMPLSDVIRTASSEIELYDRVHLDLPVDPLMLGHHALGAAHLLAELLENATMFSEPHTPVEVATATAEGYLVVTIRDHGLGMTAAEVAEANRRVASRTAQDAVGAQRLGLYVVGRIADRLGAAISFAVGANTAGYSGAGTLVTVAFPAGLFLPDDAVVLPEPTDPLEIAAPMPAAAPLPSAPAAPAPSFARAALPDEPAPSYQAVDLTVLTDGTTTAGMPRRRTAQPETSHSEPLPASPVDPVQSEHPEFDQMVLPVLEAPVLAAELTTDTAIWAPATAAPASTVSVSAALPSRARTAEPEPVTWDPEPISVPTMAVQERSAFFTSFRSLGELEETVGGAIHLDAVIEDPAAVPEPPVEYTVPAPPAEHTAQALAAPELTPAYDRREPVLANAAVGGEVVSNAVVPSAVHGSSSGHGRSVLPLRSSIDALAGPLDPYAIPDTLEARSEWMASAVLYEEMSALLRRGVFAEQAAALSAGSSDEAAYRPVLAGSDAPGLLRRGSSTHGASGDSGSTVNPATDRFTARIERDPEQVRSRFSAFQSATALARSLDEADWPST
jgi:signal transduction histidine kinase